MFYFILFSVKHLNSEDDYSFSLQTALNFYDEILILGSLHTTQTPFIKVNGSRLTSMLSTFPYKSLITKFLIILRKVLQGKK